MAILCGNGAFTFNYGAVVRMGKMFIQIYADYAVLSSSLNAISRCGILEFQPVLRQKQYLTAFIHAQESLPGARRFPVGNPFTVNHITYAHGADGRVSKPNRTSHDRGLSHRKVQNQALLTPD